MENQNRPQQRKGLLGFLWPYIVIIGFIGLFVYFILYNNSYTTNHFTESQVAELLDDEERLVTDEANSNNELINLNLQSFLAPRQEACRQFNEKFGLTGTDKEISVRVRSDLYNIIKKEMSITSDYNEDIIEEEVEDEE